jgi:hypothetical protein
MAAPQFAPPFERIRRPASFHEMMLIAIILERASRPAGYPEEP